jgi:hypothetical protein
MDKQFDLIVVETGAAGSLAAYRWRETRWTVAIDSRPFGDRLCLLDQGVRYRLPGELIRKERD